MRYKIMILTLAVIFFGILSSQGQCGNKISVSSRVNDSVVDGVIFVDVKSDTNFTCTLVVETVSGDILIERKKGRGNKSLGFKNLMLGKLYSVRVNFSNKENFLCNKLSKTIILK